MIRQETLQYLGILLTDKFGHATLSAAIALISLALNLLRTSYTNLLATPPNSGGTSTIPDLSLSGTSEMIDFMTPCFALCFALFFERKTDSTDLLALEGRDIVGQSKRIRLRRT